MWGWVLGCSREAVLPGQGPGELWLRPPHPPAGHVNLRGSLSGSAGGLATWEPGATWPASDPSSVSAEPGRSRRSETCIPAASTQTGHFSWAFLSLRRFFQNPACALHSRILRRCRDFPGLGSQHSPRPLFLPAPLHRTAPVFRIGGVSMLSSTLSVERGPQCPERQPHPFSAARASVKLLTVLVNLKVG